MNKKVIKLPSILTICLLVMLACNKDEINLDYAQMNTTVIAIQSNSVEVRADISYQPASDPVVEYGFIYGKIPAPFVYPNVIYEADTIIVEAQFSGDSFFANIQRNLDRGEDYYVTAYMKSEDWIAQGAEAYFTFE